MEASLEEAWNRWMDCLSGDDRNSIFSQIAFMLWDTAIYQIILEGRKFRIKENPEKPQVNLQLHAFIDRNYFQVQSAAIRRIVDDSFDMHGSRGVYSLPAIIKDLKRNREKLNRETYLTLRGLPYDYSEIQAKEHEFFLSHASNQNLFTIPQELNWQRIEGAHRVFDRLSYVEPEKRSPEDLIDEEVFSCLEKRLEECDPLLELVNKFIAHSATPESRSGIDVFRIKGSEVWRLQKILYEIANFLGTVLFSVDTVPIPDLSYSVYSNWDKPLYLEDEEHVVYEIFEKFEKETDNWRVNSVDNMWKMIEEQ